ncbi:mitofusin, partial [Entophlyctis luteolus]
MAPNIIRSPSRTDSSSSSAEDAILTNGTTEYSQHQALSAHAQNRLFAEKRTRMLGLLKQTSQVLSDLTSFAPGVLRVPPGSSEPNGAQSLTVLGGPQGFTSTSGDIETHLLTQKLSEAQSHTSRLLLRIEDTRSRVLVTGDLNGGKSTFVNALLRRHIVPDDQQPCTALFCEVVDSIQNNGVEEVHGIKDASKYDPNNPDTYVAFSINVLREVVEENEPGFEMLKVYCHDGRPKEESVLNNGIVDISLIDSPGLNIDSMKTTSLM